MSLRISRRVSRRLRLSRMAVVAAIVCCSSAFGQPMTGYSGKAYGTNVLVQPVNTTIASGPTAVSTICTETAGISDTNSVASVSLGVLASTGVIDTSVSSADISAGSSSTAIAEVNGISLLGGLITADAVKSVSSSISSAGGYSTSSMGTNFTKAIVAGIPIRVDVAPNTRIVLAGIGYVILNEEIANVGATSASLTVNAIHVHVSQSNSLNLPVGTQVIVAHAQSSTLANVALISGFGYGSSVTAAGVLDAGRTAVVVLNCSGVDEDETNSTAGVNVPGVLTTGVVHTSAQESVSSSSAAGDITASVAGLNLLTGLVTATTITADAGVSASGSNITLSDSGSIFVDLTVAGHPEVGANPAPNTHVSIAGLGTLWLHRVIKTSTSIEVRMVELVVDAANTLGLPIGADVRISVAHVGVTQ